MRILIGLLIVLIFSSCEKKELPAPKYDRGDVQTMQVPMTNNYKNQIWVSLSENKIVSTNFKTDWDLAFETSAIGYHVLMNTGLSSRVYKTNETQLQNVIDTVGLGINGTVDTPTGNLDSTAIGNWQTDNKVYMIDRGYSETGQHLGYYKIKFMSVTASQFTFEYAPIFGTQTYTATITKNSDCNFSMYSFNTHQQVQVEPLKVNYDLCFTQFTHIFTNPLHYYLVSGALINPTSTRVTIIKDKPFAEININDTLSRSFSSFVNSIGYDWKTFDLNNNLYTVNSSLCYVIHDSKGFYYKLHFIDFYNASGIKGYPTFEFKKL